MREEEGEKIDLNDAFTGELSQIFCVISLFSD